MDPSQLVVTQCVQGEAFQLAAHDHGSQWGTLKRQQLQSASSDFNEVKNHHRVGHVSACGVSDFLVCCWVVGAWGVLDDENLLACCYVEDFLEVKGLLDVEDSKVGKGSVVAEDSERATGLVMCLCDVLGVEAQAYGPCECGSFTHGES